MSKHTRDVLEKGARPKSKRQTKLIIEHPCSDVEGDSPAPDQPCFGTYHPDSHTDLSLAGAGTLIKEVWASEAMTPRRKSKPNDDESGLG